MSESGYPGFKDEQDFIISILFIFLISCPENPKILEILIQTNSHPENPKILEILIQTKLILSSQNQIHSFLNYLILINKIP
jgi:hypothetical protein